MIALSFPRLRRLPLTVHWGGEDDLLCYSARAGRYFIAVNECLRPARRRVIEGGMAHELCHIEADLRMGTLQREFAWRRYIGSPYCRIREERAVERRAIELGYGPQLLAFVEFAHRLGYRFGREHGLLYREIRQAVAGGKTAGPTVHF